jgi:hypothetical protein
MVNQSINSYESKLTEQIKIPNRRIENIPNLNKINNSG